jgi:titin
VVERKDVASAQWSSLSTTSKKKSHMAKHLTEGNQYLFRVAAENQYGRGPFVETPKPIKALDPLRELLSLNTKVLFDYLWKYYLFIIIFF